MSPPLRVLIAVVTLFALAPTVASAHESRPLHVELVEDTSGGVALRWRVPGSVPSANRPVVSLSAPCAAEGDEAGTGSFRWRVYRCGDALADARLDIVWPRFRPSVTTLIRVERSRGERHTEILPPGETRWTLPPDETRGRVAGSYFRLGARHILEGGDHLLFVACLLFIAATPRRVLVTVTGFTLAHSVTLALASLGLVRVPVPPVEAAIALSIVLLAREIVRDRREGLAWRRPVLVASSFGLLHGLGFASVLADVGLPQHELPTALLFFNLGVEAGQLLFVAALGALALTLGRLLHRDAAGTLAPFRLPVGYASGILASLWLLERVSAFGTPA
jgi:hydrogenase/urease accessory protein HupE